MSNLYAAPAVFHGDSRTDKATPSVHWLGDEAREPGGIVHRWALAGGTALVVGKLQQSPAEVTNHQDLTPTATAAAATSITATLGATAATANQYAEGWAVITVTPGVGQKYRIKSHPAADASASLTVTLYGDESVVTALTTTSRVDLVLNPYSGVIVCPTTLTGSPVGGAVQAITASQYGWIQTKGPGVLLADGANAVGANVVASNGVAGAVEDAASPGAQPFVGTALTGAADTEYGMVLINL